MKNTNYEFYMRKALKQAIIGAAKGEVPIGAVIIDDKGRVLARAHNQIEGKKTQTAHAEMLAVYKAAQKIDNWRLDECTIFVTLEPCAMCMGLIILSRIKRVVYGAPSPKFGYHLDNCIALNLYKNKLEIVSNICSSEATVLLQNFFQKRREGNEKGDKRG